ncbi:MAG: hypothetical protein U0W40_03915 [Acidimicrobiia bacterium]
MITSMPCFRVALAEPQPWQPPDSSTWAIEPSITGERRGPAVRGDLRVDLLVDDGDDALRELAGEVGVGEGRRRRLGLVRVLHHHAAVEAEHGTAQVVGALGGDGDGEAGAVVEDDVAGELGLGPELHEVRVGAGLLPVDLHPEREGFAVGLRGADLQHLLEGFVGDRQQIAHAHHATTPPPIFPVPP